MKKLIAIKSILIVMFVLLMSTISNAQTGLNFQGVARSSNNVIIASQQISLRLTILQGSATGSVEYSETRKVTTNAQGLFAVVIGDADATSAVGSFNNINWKNTPKYLKIEMDANAGNNYTTIGTTQFQYVAYAQFANSVDAENIIGVVPVARGGTGATNLAALKTTLALDKINNTADVDKPISVKTQAALDLISVTASDTSRFSSRINAKANTVDVNTSLALKANTSDITTSLTSKLNKTDTSYLLQKADTISLSNRIDLKSNTSDVATSLTSKLNKTDTSYLLQKADTISLSNRIDLKSNTSDVATSLISKLNKTDTSYLLQKADTTNLSNRINLKANVSDFNTGLATKVDKVTGKVLSANDYTNTEKTKLAAITGTNTGDQDLSTYATITALSLKANTSDINTSLGLKASVTDVTTSLALKEDATNKSAAADLGGVSPSDILYPTQKAVKDFVAANSASGGVADGGITNIKLADRAVTYAKFQSIPTNTILGNTTSSTAVVQAIATTGSDNVVLSTSPLISSPTLVTPNLGVATATTINNITMSAAGGNPATLSVIGTASIKRDNNGDDAPNQRYENLLTDVVSLTTSQPIDGQKTFQNNLVMGTMGGIVGINTPTTINFANGSKIGDIQNINEDNPDADGSIDLYAPDGAKWVQLNYDDINYIGLGSNRAFIEVGGEYWRFNNNGTTDLPGDLNFTDSHAITFTSTGTSTPTTNASINSEGPLFKIQTREVTKTEYDADRNYGIELNYADRNYLELLDYMYFVNHDDDNSNEKYWSAATFGYDSFNFLINNNLSQYSWEFKDDGSTVLPGALLLTGNIETAGTIKLGSTIFTNQPATNGYVLTYNNGNAVWQAPTGTSVSDNIDANTLTGTILKSTITGSSLTSVGTLANLTVTDAIVGSITGNAATATTATKLATARNINGVAFDGSEDITITASADAGTLTGTTLKSTITGSSLTSVGTLANLTVTDAIVGSITGNAATATSASTATKLSTARNINGIAFDGSGDITILTSADAGTLTGTTLKSTITGSSLTSVGTLANLTVTNAINGSITGNAATVTTNANLTGVVTSVGNITSIATGTISNSMLANTAVANLSGVNTGDDAVNSRYSSLTADIANLDNTLNARINSKVTNAAHYGDIKAMITGSDAYYVIGINGTLLKYLETGILKNTTGTGVPSIAVASDFPTLNQSTTGNSATTTKLATSINVNGVAFDGTGDITIAANAGTLTGTSLNETVVSSSLTSVGTLSNLTVTNTINGSVNGNAATTTKLVTSRNINGVAFDGTSNITITADAGTLTGTSLKSTVTSSSLTSVGTLANLTVTNPISGSITGNAATASLASTATKLTTARNINGIAFDGTSNITVAASAGTLTGTTLNATVTGSSLTSVGVLNNATVNGKVIVGAAAEASSTAILEASSTTQGFLPPRMTIVQRIAIVSPAQGLMIYCTNCGTYGEPQYYNGNAWMSFAGTASSKSTPTINITVGTYTFTASTPQGPNSATNTGTGTTYTYTYVGTGSTTYASSATKPTNAGTYSVTASLSASGDGNYNAATASAAFTIAQAIPTVTPTIGTYAYSSGVAKGPDAATNTGTGTTYTYSYSGIGITTYGPSATKPIDGGTYTVIATLAANGNYAASSSSATAFRISLSLAVGNTYGGGKVAYILKAGDIGYDANQQHGLIVSGYLSTNAIVWGDKLEITGASGGLAIYNNDYGTWDYPPADLETGMNNTNLIISSEGAGTNYPASIARAYSGGGYTNWYLPSASQMNAMKANLSPSGVNFVWTSTEWSYGEAFIWNSINGGYQTQEKNSAFAKFLAARSF
jgi:hypothetical protein